MYSIYQLRIIKHDLHNVTANRGCFTLYVHALIRGSCLRIATPPWWASCTKTPWVGCNQAARRVAERCSWAVLLRRQCGRQAEGDSSTQSLHSSQKRSKRT
ncbi:hypothetical protein KC19_11G121400 [Ceratodon purpureus]|uniref:Uncharacterized protein n=1 Tax=Ceratodon purpureus TaxID=3225 RepID=A0A8T0GFL6_CERPU|nr:hypothetical protein KC19_11G121400 [Ceratodon purpureus]